MIDFEKRAKEQKNGGVTIESLQSESSLAVPRIFRLVYGWMAFGLAVSGAIAYGIFSSGMAENFVKSGLLMPLLIAEVVLVIVFTLNIRKMGYGAMIFCFALYAALNGATLSTIFLIYKMAVIQKVFFLTAGMFLGLCFFGTVTKSDCSKIGAICGMGLWGLILASLVNLFLRSPGMDYVVSLIGVAVFTGLTMYDAQKISGMASLESSLDRETQNRLGIMGALALYLDFINLFLYLLRLFGRRK